MKPKVFIRTDGDSNIGLGHIVRTIALAQMIKKTFNVIFVCSKIPQELRDDLQNQNFSLVIIKKETSFLKKIKKKAIVVIDGYNFNSLFQQSIKETGATLVCIDDLHDKHYYADLIINYSPGITAHDYDNLSYTKFLLGPDYVLLRTPFIRQCKFNRKIEKIESAFVCFGGSDSNNYTMKTLSTIIKHEYFLSFNVVTGASYQHLKELQNYSLIDRRIKLFHAINETKVLTLMKNSDLAIVPASVLLLEAIAAGCIIISGKTAGNQLNAYNNYKKLSAFYDAFDFSDFNLNLALNQSLIKNANQIFDGLSGKRILKHFCKLHYNNLIEMRKASIFDIKITLKWANHKSIRSNSFDNDKISKKTHQTWFLNKINSKSCHFYIAEIHKEPIGLIRFDIVDDDAVISYLVDPKFQGKGIGEIILEKGIAYFINHIPHSHIKALIAYVKKNNCPSIALFNKLRFCKTDLKDRIKFERTL